MLRMIIDLVVKSDVLNNNNKFWIAHLIYLIICVNFGFTEHFIYNFIHILMDYKIIWHINTG